MKDLKKKQMQPLLNKITYSDKPTAAKNGYKSVTGVDCNINYERNTNEEIHVVHSSPVTDEVLKSLLNLSTDIITVLTNEGIILFESDSIESMLGYDKNELIGQNAFMYVHKDDLKRVYSDFNTGLLSPGKPIISSYRFRKADGSYIFLETAGVKFKSDDSNNLVIISRDVTSRVETEKKIRRLTAAVEQSSNTIVITDIEGRIEYVNKKFADLTGYSKDEAVGGNPSILRSGTTPKEIYKDLWTTILTGSVWQGEIKNKKKIRRAILGKNKNYTCS